MYVCATPSSSIEVETTTLAAAAVTAGDACVKRVLVVGSLLEYS